MKMHLRNQTRSSSRSVSHAKVAPLWLSLLLLCGCSLAACSTQKTVPLYPTLPQTTCLAPAQIPTKDLASDTAFAKWLNSADGRQYLVSEREHSWDCYRRLKAVHDFALTWPKSTK